MYIGIHSLCSKLFVAPLAAITASIILGFEATSLAHLSMASFAHSSLQNLSSSIRLEGSVGAQQFSDPSKDVQWD